MNETADIFIVGGGINGTGIARDAAGRGQKVILVEQDDLANATSSASSKLIHGGLRYLEHYEFTLVRKALREREVLWKIAPHLIKPLRFILPHHKGLRPAAILRLGLFLYDHMGGRKLLPPTKTLNLRTHVAGAPLTADFRKAFEYSDCWVDDARLVVLNALGASEKGANILPRHKFLAARRQQDWWHIDIESPNGKKINFKARTLINAAGPWVEQILQNCVQKHPAKSTVRLVKGSHIVVPKLYDHAKAYTFQNADGRIIFSIPYERHFTLIGTTDIPFQGSPQNSPAQPDEIDYLCAAASEYFRQPVRTDDVVWTYSGIRPLYDDGAESASAATRDYVLELAEEDGALPLLSIFGGKITTYRCLAEEALEKLAPYLKNLTAPWTDSAPLPGGDLPGRNNPQKAFEDFVLEIRNRAGWLDDTTTTRMARAYGTRVFSLLDGARSPGDLGQHFGQGLYAKEIDFLVREEWAKTAEDILWRRSKIGLHMSKEEKHSVALYMEKICLNEQNPGRIAPLYPTVQ